MRSRRLRGGRDQDDLLRSEIDQLVDEANEARRPVAQAMRLAAPVALGCERDTVPVGREGQRQRCGDRVGQMIPADAGQIEHLGAPCVRGLRRRPPHETAPPRLRHQREHEIAARVDVVRGHEQLAEPGLPEVGGEQLGTSSGGGGCFSCAAPRTRSHSTRHV